MRQPKCQQIYCFFEEEFQNILFIYYYRNI